MLKFPRRSPKKPIQTWFIVAIAVVLTILIGCGISPFTSNATAAQTQVFEQAWETINTQFFDPNFNGVDWKAQREKYRAAATQAKSPEAFADVINQMLADLKTSHTRYYIPSETAYYQLLGIFQPRSRDLKNLPKTIFPNGKLEYSGIGIFTKTLEGKTFVSGVLEGSPAAQAGLLAGDEILSADGKPFQQVQSFSGKVNQPVQLKIQRQASSSSSQEITVTPKLFNPLTMFLDTQKASNRIIQQDGKKLGYVHIWSYAGDQYQDQLEEDLFYGPLKDADGLILDLRNGWGGAPLDALNIYTARGPSITSIPRNRQRYVYRAQWNKPVVMLVNEGSRSAKEILAYGFQKYKIGTVVGSKTPGAVVAGRAFLMQDGSLLYVAVADVYVDDKTRLEGVGVAPDIEVPFSLPYAQGADPQKERAIAVLLQQVSQTTTVP